MPSAFTMETEASHMLEAALEQMDDIIAGSKTSAMEFSYSVHNLDSPFSIGPLQVTQLAEDLKLALELQPNQEERDSLRAQLPTETAKALVDWLQSGNVNLCSAANNETYQERLLRLEGDKESLVLQVSVLTDQVEAQGEKIRDLESSLKEHRQKLASSEEMLQQELMSRMSLETQKLDLMDEVRCLKLKLANMDETHTSTQLQDHVNTKQNKAEDLLQEVKMLKSKVDELEGEKSQYERRLRATKFCISYSLHVCYQSLMTQLSSLRLTVKHTQLEKQHLEERWRSTQTEISDLQQLLATRNAEIECLQTQLLAVGGTATDNAEKGEMYIKHLVSKYQEYQNLKVGMESLLASNDEKDRQIQELTILLGQYQKREVMALAMGSSEEELSGSLKLRAITHKTQSDILTSEMSSRGSSPLILSSSAYQGDMDTSIQTFMDSLLASTGENSFFNGSWPQRRLLSSSLEELQSGSLQKNPHLELSRYQTLPGKLSRRRDLRAEMNGSKEREGDYLPPARDHEQDYSMTGCTEKLDDCILSDQSPLSSVSASGQHSLVSPETRKSHRGIKKLWGRIRRSQSGSPVQVLDPELGDFKRGGFRATAGPRLAHSGNTRDLKMPFSKWSTEQVCGWLEDIGLGQYSILACHWVTSGETLVSATPQDFEKELAMKNPLHRKKLQLAINTFSSKQPEKSAELDYTWVNRWLDDIGLPQYKDQFNESRVDGLMLQYLTVNDLLYLKVSSQLHHLSIKCAIHVLHVNKFKPNCLKRRPSSESQFAPTEVVQWSNHRVMEWLRSVDLAEYAPNLRGSGVHGGLIMLEPRFNSDTLALLLNIPPQKTLLRRHITTNFNSLIGAKAQQEKREYTKAAGYTLLNITAKVKPKKLGFSNLTHLRRRQSDESTDYVCPITSSSSPSGQSLVNGVHMHSYCGARGLSPITDREADYARI
ncbi:liprin-beta-2b isoform X6 [Betta splendens]|uniref:Liprin-beta-2b isoform X6 n=1 Tax=Betta splendens TaxID=158456 RepID=A0A9W2XUP4_BETSP|nr:liprin-beta-2b isoform X6 [Betta splendens]